MADDESPCRSGRITSESLSALNRSPLTFLANCGVRHGGPFGKSFLQAQELLERHGSSRRIEGDAACTMCGAMQLWAEAASNRTA